MGARSKIWVLQLLLAASVPPAHATDLGHQDLVVRTIGDLERACQPFLRGATGSSEALLRAATCTAYLGGFFHGYSGTLTQQAAADLSALHEIPVEEMSEHLDKDVELHDELNQRVLRAMFICAFVPLRQVVAALMQEFGRLGPEYDKKAAHYAVITALRTLFPCPPRKDQSDQS